MGGNIKGTGYRVESDPMYGRTHLKKFNNSGLTGTPKYSRLPKQEGTKRLPERMSC